MKFYQGHFDDTFGEVRASLEEAMKDLDEAGFDSNQLIKGKSGLWYTSPFGDQLYGIAEIIV